MKKAIGIIFTALTIMAIFVTSVVAASTVNLNSASQKELEALKGVGPATAKKIIAARPYASVDQLSKAGLSAKQIDSLKGLVSVSAAPAVAAPAPVSAATSAKKPPAATMPAKAAPAPARPVDLNTASQKELEALKGVGAVTAKKIIAARPLGSVDDLSRAGVSAKTIAELKPYVSVSTPRVASRPIPMPVPVPAPVPAPISKPVPTPVPAAPKAAPSAVAPAVTPAPKSATTKSAVPKLAAGQTVNINTASREMIEALPGIGPVKSQAIIDGRPYSTIEDIMKVKGIKQGEFAKIKDLITVR